MPKLPAEKRKEVYDYYCLGRNAEYIFESVFHGNSSIIKLESLKPISELVSLEKSHFSDSDLSVMIPNRNSYY